MPPSETSNSNTIVQEKCNIAEVENKNLKKTIMNMFKDLKDNSSKDLKEICESTTVQWNKLLNNLECIGTFRTVHQAAQALRTTINKWDLIKMKFLHEAEGFLSIIWTKWQPSELKKAVYQLHVWSKANI